MKGAAAAVVLAASLAAFSSSAADAAVTIAKDCTQEQRTFIITLLEQDKNPFRACATRARGDITVLSTSRLCPIPECKVWIQYMAENAPNCVYDDTNYGEAYLAKAKDCGTAVADGSTGNDADSPSAGSNSTQTPAPTLAPRAPSNTSHGSKSGSKDDDDDNTIEEPVSTIPTVTVPSTPKTTTAAPITPAPSGAATLNVVATLSAVALSVAALAF